MERVSRRKQNPQETNALHSNGSLKESTRAFRKTVWPSIYGEHPSLAPVHRPIVFFFRAGSAGQQRERWALSWHDDKSPGCESGHRP